MSLFDKVNEDIKTAMKAKEAEKLMAIRAIKSELLLAKTAKGGTDEISEAEEIKILQKMVKQRRESAAIYKEQGRQDLFAKEALEADVIEQYMPKKMGDDELVAIIKDIISSSGATSAKEMGKVMGIASKQLAGKADNKKISELVKSLLPQ